jgi:hypothetical protein
MARPNVLVKIDENKPIRNGPTTIFTSGHCLIADIDLYITDFDEVNDDLRNRFLTAFQTSTITVSLDYIAKANDVLLVDSSSGAITITLPPAINNMNKEIYIKKISADSNYVIVSSIDGIDSKSVINLKQQWTAIGLISNGTSWEIIGTVLCYPTP